MRIPDIQDQKKEPLPGESCANDLKKSINPGGGPAILKETRVTRYHQSSLPPLFFPREGIRKKSLNRIIEDFTIPVKTYIADNGKHRDKRINI